MAYSVYYLFMGLNTDLPWSRCNDDSFNTLNCYSLLDAESCTETQLYWNRTCTEIDDFCNHYGFHDYENNTHCLNSTSDPDDTPFKKKIKVPVQNISLRVSPSEEFWYKKVLELSVTFTSDGTKINLDENSWSNWGHCNWKLAGCLLLCWALVACILIKGAQSYGKAVYFTTLFPYVVLITLLGYVATLPGFTKGIEYYLTPDWR